MHGSGRGVWVHLQTIQVSPKLKVMFERCVRWLRKGVLPVIVLEGEHGGRTARVSSGGRGCLGPAFAAHGRIRILLAALGVPYVDAEGEAEATCLGKALICSTRQIDFGKPNKTTQEKIKYRGSHPTYPCEYNIGDCIVETFLKHVQRRLFPIEHKRTTCLIIQ